MKPKRYRLTLNTPPESPIMIIDGKYLLYRNQYSSNMRELSYKGISTGLYYGFFNTMRQLAQKFYPINTVIMWDAPGRSIRREEFFGYKDRAAKQKSYMTPEQQRVLQEIQLQYPELIGLCEFLGFASYMLPGYEADDAIALFVNRFSKCSKVIITRDEDMYQCIDDRTFVYSPDDKKKKDLAWFRKTYEINPNQWGLVKAIGGCKSDTVPGVEGIGEKKAIAYLKGELNEKQSEKITTFKNLELFKRLTVLPHPGLKDYHIPYKITNMQLSKWFEVCQNMGFRSFIERFDEFEFFSQSPKEDDDHASIQ